MANALQRKRHFGISSRGGGKWGEGGISASVAAVLGSRVRAADPQIFHPKPALNNPLYIAAAIHLLFERLRENGQHIDSHISCLGPMSKHLLPHLFFAASVLWPRFRGGGKDADCKEKEEKGEEGFYLSAESLSFFFSSGVSEKQKERRRRADLKGFRPLLPSLLHLILTTKGKKRRRWGEEKVE